MRDGALQALCRDARMLPAGGAPDIELCQQLQKYGRTQTGLDQYAIAKYAESFEVIAALSALKSEFVDVTVCCCCVKFLGLMTL